VFARYHFPLFAKICGKYETVFTKQFTNDSRENMPYQLQSTTGIPISGLVTGELFHKVTN